MSSGHVFNAMQGGASESLSSFVHNQLSYSDDDIADACANAFYTPPRHAWGTYLSWGSLVDCLTDSFAENASPPSGQDYVYLPKLHRRDTQKSFEYMPKLAERLSQSWVHLTGDSVMFLEFMAIYQLFVQGNSRAGVPSPLLRCALPLEGKASANQYESFQLCDPLIHLDGTSMKNKTDSDKDGHHKTQVVRLELNRLVDQVPFGLRPCLNGYVWPFTPPPPLFFFFLSL